MDKLIEVMIEPGTGLRLVPEVEAYPGDTVLFQAGDDTVSIWFPQPGVFSTTEIATMQTGDIHITIPSGATPGTYEYAIYVHTVRKYAECHSHPVMIIKGP
jgi:hypothetical protein